MTPAALSPCFADIVRPRLGPEARDWFEAAVGGPGAGDPERFWLGFGQAARRVGRAPVSLDAAERARLAAVGLAGGLDGWRVDEVARVSCLLVAAQRLEPEGLDRLVEGAWHRGDSLAARAVLKALPLLPAPERFLVLALAGARSTLQLVFDAIACGNRYPAAHFHEIHFNDLVVKAIAADIAPARIVGLDARVNPALVRLAQAHVALRRAAGRPVSLALGRLAAGAAA